VTKSLRREVLRPHQQIAHLIFLDEAPLACRLPLLEQFVRRCIGQ